MSLHGLPTPRAVPKRSGLDHVFAAAAYSMGGLRFLLREQAFRHELLLAAVLLGLLAFFDAPISAFLLQGALLLLLAAFEAMNTAIELIVDRVSPEFSAFAKHAKDLGSFSVFCMLAANAFHAGAVAFGLA